MTNGPNAEIARDPRFREVAARRNRLAWTLFAVTMVLYFGLILTATLNPSALAAPITPGGTTAVGWPIGALVIVIPWILTIVYVRRANSDGREMTKIVNEVLA